MALTAAQREELIGRYERGPEVLRAAFARVPREALKWRPGEKKWSVHEIVCHCADSEMNAAARIRYLAAEAEPVIPGYDQARWAELFDYHQARVDLALAAVDVMRAHTTNLIRRLPEAVWTKVARHTEKGAYTGEDWLHTYAEHLEKHARQIEGNLGRWREEETTPRAPAQ